MFVEIKSMKRIECAT